MDPARRRLTVGYAAKPAVEAPEISPEEARGLLHTLKKEDLLAMAKTGSGRRGSIASKTDQKLRNHASFGEKQQVREGDDLDETVLTSLKIGATCRKGRKPESPNQDSWSLLHIEEVGDLYGVYDGHGPNGHDVSNFAREVLPKLFMRHAERDSNPEAALVDAFQTTQKLIEASTEMEHLDASMSGTTCTVAWRPRVGPLNGKLVVAHVGDSRCILLKRKADGEMCAQDLTVDHKPNLPAERQRIESRGGRVVFDGFFNHRVFKKGALYPGLNMSRALGDIVGHVGAGLTAMPDVTTVDLKGAAGVVVATDGVWEFIESDAAAALVGAYKPSDCQAASERLSAESWERWMSDSDNEISDDITAIILRLD